MFDLPVGDPRDTCETPQEETEKRKRNAIRHNLRTMVSTDRSLTVTDRLRAMGHALAKITGLGLEDEK